MYTILIADDEKEEQEGISFLMDEFHYPLEKSFASNGKIALSYLTEHPVDILFTDVRMPIMNGLELAQKAKALYPDLEIIIFSGFSEFEYAKTAIQIGVSSYILKPVNVEEFQGTIDQVLKRLDSRKEQKATTARQEKYAKKHILFRLINHTCFEPEELAEFFQIPFTYQKMILLEFESDFFDRAGSAFEKSILSVLSIPADYLNLNMCQSILLLKETPGDFSCFEEMEQIYQWILENYKRNCYIAITDSIPDVKRLSSSFTELEQLMEYRFFVPDTYIFQNNRAMEEYFETEIGEDLLLDTIKKDLMTKDFTGLNTHVDILCYKYKKLRNFSHLYVKFIFSNLYKDILMELEPVTELELNQGIDRLYRSNDIHEIVLVIKEAVAKLEYSYSNVATGASHEVDMVKDYIGNHYGEDLDLVSLADKVYLSPRYLSTLFKKVMGCGINKYIKTIRMEKAKELLAGSNIKIVDLCTAVGFHNLSYFCQNFREYYGETPEQYRKLAYYRNRH